MVARAFFCLVVFAFVFAFVSVFAFVEPLVVTSDVLELVTEGNKNDSDLGPSAYHMGTCICIATVQLLGGGQQNFP